MNAFQNVLCKTAIAFATFAVSTSADEITAPAQASLIHDVQIPAREPGVLTELLVREGAQVKKGDVLGRVDTTLTDLQGDAAAFESQIAALQVDNDVNLRFARKSSQVSQAELARFEEANRAYPKAITKSEFEEAQFVAERAELSIEQAEIEMETAKLTGSLKRAQSDIANARIDMSVIESPIAGMVVKLNRQQGEWAQAGEPIIRVINLEKLRVEAFVDQSDCDASSTGRTAVFTTTVAGKERKFEGTLVFVSPEIDPVDGVVKVWAEVNNDDMSLRPGAKGTLTIRD